MKSKGLYLRNDFELRSWIRTVRACGQKIVFTNGVFDLLHAGHNHLLWRIHEDLRGRNVELLVALNDDISVSSIKPGRPILPVRHRINLLCSHRAVDAVTTFSEDTPFNLIKTCMPDFLVKGGDYRGKKIVGEELVLDNGGAILFIDSLDDDCARTSDIIKRVLEAEKKYG